MAGTGRQVAALAPAIGDDGTIERVSVGVMDGHRAALDLAAAEAARRGAELVLVHSYQVPPTAMSSMYAVDVTGSFEEAGHAVLEDARRHLAAWRPGLRVRTELRRGTPCAALERASGESDLLVIGTDRAKSWLMLMAEGRVSRRIIETAHCPVVVVPDTWSASDDRDDVVVMVDDETSAEGPLRLAFQMAALRSERLRVLHVESPRGTTAVGETAQVLERRRTSWGSSFPTVDVEWSVVTGDVEDVTTALGTGTGVLVLGRRHGSRWFSARGESLAQHAVQSPGCAVVVVPAEHHRGSPVS